MKLSIAVERRARVYVRIWIFAEKEVLEIPKIGVFKYHRAETWRNNNSAERSDAIVAKFLEHFDFAPKLVNLLRIRTGS